ncbi:hypothetical protein D3C87_1628310 [compost metagenome]
MVLAEQRALPTAEGMPGHGHRNRHVDADHAYLNAAGESPRHATITSETGHTVTELVSIDQLHCGGEVRHSKDSQNWPKDFFFVDGHFRGDFIEQRRPHEKALLSARHRQATTVHDQLRALVHSAVDIAFDLGLMHRRYQRTHIRLRISTIAHSKRIDTR